MASSGTTTMEQSKKFNKAFVSVAGKLQNPSRFKRFGRSSPFIRYGLPMISFTVLGTLGLGHLLQGRLILIHQLSMCMYCIAHYSTILNYCMDIVCINFLFFLFPFPFYCIIYRICLHTGFRMLKLHLFLHGLFITVNCLLTHLLILIIIWPHKSSFFGGKEGEKCVTYVCAKY